MHDLPSEQPRRILVFGGTFDPPHLAHAILPAQAAAQLSCDLILYIPAAINPLKSAAPTASNEHRMAMLLLATADVPNARISAVEIDRTGPSYTIDTLVQLHAEYSANARRSSHAGVSAATPVAARSQSARTASAAAPPAPTRQDEDESPEFFLLIGCDQALDFHRWKDWQRILTLATPAVMLRPPWTEASFREALESKYSKVEAESWMKWTLRLPMMDISATEIRKRLRAGDDAALAELLDPAVLKYIRANNLYAA